MSFSFKLDTKQKLSYREKKPTGTNANVVFKYSKEANRSIHFLDLIRTHKIRFN